MSWLDRRTALPRRRLASQPPREVWQGALGKTASWWLTACRLAVATARRRPLRQTISSPAIESIVVMPCLLHAGRCLAGRRHSRTCSSTALSSLDSSPRSRRRLVCWSSGRSRGTPFSFSWSGCWSRVMTAMMATNRRSYSVLRTLYVGSLSARDDVLLHVSISLLSNTI